MVSMGILLKGVPEVEPSSKLVELNRPPGCF